MDAERAAGAWRFDRYTLDLARGALLGPDGAEVPLRPKSWALLQLLVENPGRVLDRDTIMAAVWPDVVVTDESITQCVRDIRKSLGDEPQALLKTVPKRGYLLAAEVVPVASTSPPPRVERRLAAILAADVVGYSRQIEIDELGTLAALKTRRADVLTPLLAEHKGRLVKVMGDGVLVEFGSATEAVTCAAQIQQRMHEANADLAKDRAIVLRIGIQLGEIIVEHGDIYGDGVIVAVRLQQAAAPGDILVSAGIFEQVRSRLPFPVKEVGFVALKNSERELLAYSVVWNGTDDISNRQPRSIAESPAPEDRSILVIPFASLGAKDDEYLADGITEDIIIDLSQVPGLSVLSRNTSFGLKNKEVDLVGVARRLRATHVIEGGVRIAADRVRITAQLVEGRTGIHLWAERFDSRLDDIFALQSEIASKVAGALSSRLGVTKEKILANKGTKDIEAYQYYLKARSLHFMAWGNIEQLKLARHLYELATRADPGYARAYAGLADCDAYSWVQGDLDLSFDQLLANSSKALELAPNMAEAHGSRGLALHLNGKDEEASETFERAIALNPELFEPCFFYANCLRSMGRLEEAVALFERAACLSPTDPMSAAILVDVYKALGRVEESVAAAKRALATIQTALVDRPDDGHLLALGAAMLVELNRFAEAEEWAGRALAVDSENYVVRYNCACAYAMVRKLEPAMDCLNYIYDTTPRARGWLARFINHDTQLNSLHALATFQELIGKLEAPAA